MVGRYLACVLACCTLAVRAADSVTVDSSGILTVAGATPSTPTSGQVLVGGGQVKAGNDINAGGNVSAAGGQIISIANSAEALLRVTRTGTGATDGWLTTGGVGGRLGLYDGTDSRWVWYNDLATNSTHFDSSTSSNDSAHGAIVVAGGVGVGGAVYAGDRISSATEIACTTRFLPNNNAIAFQNLNQAAIYGSGSTAGAFPFDSYGNLILEARGGGNNRAVVLASAGGAYTAYLDNAGTFRIPQATSSANISTGALVVSGGAGIGGNLNVGNLGTVGGGLAISGHSGIPSAAGSSFYIGGNFGSPLVGRIYVGDGTGWRVEWAKRSGSVDTPFGAFFDSGNVGIGTTSDDGVSRLQVGGTVSATQVNLTTAGYTPYAGSNFIGISTPTAAGGIKWDDRSASGFTLQMPAAGTQLQLFGTGNASAFSIGSSLRLLVGTTADDGTTKLQVAGATQSTVGDAVVGLRVASATGRLRIRGWADTVNGAIMESCDTAETAYLPLSFGGTAYRFFAGGVTNFLDATPSQSVASGAVVVTGGVGIGGAVWSGANSGCSAVKAGTLEFQCANSSSSSSALAQFAVQSDGGRRAYLGVTSSTYPSLGGANTAYIGANGSWYILANDVVQGSVANGVFSLTTTTASTSPMTGALVVAGGVGIGGALNVGSTAAATSNNAGALVIGGGAGGIGAGSAWFGTGAARWGASSSGLIWYNAGTTAAVLRVADDVNSLTAISMTKPNSTDVTVSVPNALASTSTSTGAFVVSGGVGVGGAINAGGGIQTGANGASGSLTLYSEQGTTDHTVKLQPHTAMTEDSVYTLPSAKPSAVGKHYMYCDDEGNITFSSNLTTIAKFEKLQVDGEVQCATLKVKADTWGDDVLSPDYRLTPLPEVSLFVLNNGHLPGVPSANEVTTNGIDAAKMAEAEIRKIEELTLYAIQQDKQIARQDKQIAELQAQNVTLIERLKAIEAKVLAK